MKYIFYMLLSCISIAATAQRPDSTVIMQHVDSLITKSRALTDKQQYEEALKITTEARQKAESAFGTQSTPYAICTFNLGRIHHSLSKLDRAEALYLEAMDVQLNVTGKFHRNYAACANNLSILYRKKREYDKAESMGLETKEIYEQLDGKEHSNYIGSLMNLASIIYSRGDIKKALESFMEAKEILINAPERDSALLGKITNNVAVMYHRISDFDNAEKHYLEALAIHEKLHGKDNPLYASTLSNLAALYQTTGKYENAERSLLEALEIQKQLPDAKAGYAATLDNLGILYTTIGNYEKAEAYLLNSIEKQTEIFSDENHASILTTKGNLVKVYKQSGQYERAKQLAMAVKESLEQKTDRDNNTYSMALNNLANIYRELGEYPDAEQLLMESLAIREAFFGKESKEYGQSLNNIANFYKEIGDFERAKDYYLEALLIYEDLFGEKHEKYAMVLNNLGGIYFNLNDFANAAEYLSAAKDLRGKRLGKNHRAYAESLNNTGVAYTYLQRFEAAESMFLEAGEIYAQILGKESPQYADNLRDLADLLVLSGAKEAAEKKYLEALTIEEKVLGPEHPDYMTSLANLAMLYWETDRLDQAEDLYIKLSTARTSRLFDALGYLSEKEMEGYWLRFQKSYNVLLSFVQQTGRPAALDISANNCLYYKGLLQESSSKKLVFALSDSTAKEQYQQIRASKRRLAAQYALPIPERDNTLINELETKANTLEKALTRSIAGVGDAIRQVNWPEVQAALKPTEAAIEFVHFKNYGPGSSDSIFYAAMLLRPDLEAPLWVNLFEEKQLDALLNNDSSSNSKYISQLYGQRMSGQNLYELIWAALEPHLNGVGRIYFSPTGQLHRLNIGALPTGDNSVLADRYNLVRLGSTRQVVIPDEKNLQIKQAAIYGGLRYKAQGDTKAGTSKGKGTLPPQINRKQSLSDTLTRNIHGWDYLEKTEEERKRLSRLFKENKIETTSFSEYEGTEESFKAFGNNSAAPNIIHLATHGFFFPDEEIDDAERMKRLNYGGLWTFRYANNPMLRSGLILSKGNLAWKDKIHLPNREDGILTAYEINQMNLTGTQLVVLSACQTGLGDIRGHEGVYGLQRAFKIAGAKYLLMTLWNIPDTDETVDFMETFYRHLLEDKMPVRTAFQTAQKEMRDRNANPYYWAGFVLLE